MAAIIREGQNRTWHMNLDFVTGYTFTVVPRVTVGRWYEVELQVSNQNQISAIVNGRQQFALTVPNSGLNVSFAPGLLGSPRSPTGAAVAVQNFRIAQQTYTVSSSTAQIVLRLIAALLLAATVVQFLLALITSDRSRRLIGAPASSDDGRRTQPRHARVRALPALPLGLAVLAIGVTLLIVATPPENNVVDQDGNFHAAIPHTPPRTQNRLSFGSAASIGRSTPTMDVALSFEMRVGSEQRSKQTIVVTTLKHENGIQFYLDAKRRLWATLTYAAFDNPSGYQISKPLPVGQWTNVQFQLTRGQKVVFILNGAVVGYQEFSSPGWQGAAQLLSAGSTSRRSDVFVRDLSLTEKLYAAPVPRTRIFFSRSLQVVGFLLVVAGIILLAGRFFTRLVSRRPSNRPLVLVVFGVAGLGILINLLIDLLHLQVGSVPYVTRNTWIFSLNDSFTDFLNPLEVFRARDAYTVLGASYPPIAYWLVAPFYWAQPFGALFIYLAAFIGYFLWWIWRSILTTLPAIEAALVALVALTSFPVTYSLSRANIDISVFVLLTILVACLERERLRPAASLIGVAIAAKIVPALFLVVFLRRGRWRFIWLALAVAAGATLLGFLWFSGGLSSNIHGFASGFTSTQNAKAWSPIQISFGTNLSVWAQSIGYAVYGVQGGGDVAQVMQHLEIPVEVLGALLLALYVRFIDQELWRVVTLIVTAILLLPTPSGDYELLYLFAPIAVFLRYAGPTQRHLFVAVIFGLLLAPRVYFFVGDYFVGTDTLLTAPLLILLAVLVVKDGFMERARRQVLPLPVTAMPLEVPQSG